MTVKNQHFVPKFYLKFFSTEKNNRQIGLFNTSNNLYIPRASLNSQAYKTYFYGKDNNMEEELSKLENSAKPLISKIITNFYVPIYQSDDQKLLLEFALAMDLRNPIPANNFQTGVNDALKLAFPDLMQNGYKFVQNEAASLQLSYNLKKALNMCRDLDYKLLVNETPIPYVTSDFPLVKYNQCFEKRKWPIDNTGFLNMGLQLFLPLNPKTLLLFFDKSVYKVGDKNRKIINITSPSDISQINILQFLNCESTIYFNEEINENQIRNLFIESKKYLKGNNPIVVKKNNLIVDGKKSNKEFLFHTIRSCRSNLSLSFIKESSYTKSYNYGNELGHNRKYWRDKMDFIKFLNDGRAIPPQIDFQ